MKENKKLTIINKEDLAGYKHHLTVGVLRAFLNKYNLDDNALVMVQRVEDTYYENNNWGVYLKDGEFSREFPDDIEFKEQYHPAWCCARYKDDEDILFIDLHY